MTKRFNVKGMTCASCTARVEKAVTKLSGVNKAEVNLLTGSMTVEFDAPCDSSVICKAVSSAGYSADIRDGSDKKRVKTENNDELNQFYLRLGFSFLFLLPLMYISMGYTMWGFSLPDILSQSPLLCAVSELILCSAILVINQKYFINGFKSIIHLSPGMDALVSLGAAASFIYSVAVLYTADSHELLHGLYFESAGMIVTLITLGKTLEALSKRKTTSAIRSLAALSPDMASVIRDGAEIKIKTSEMTVGDIFIVRPGESVPADGTVISGESTVDESAMTGESIPVEKTEGMNVFAATINRSGVIRCKAERVGQDTSLGKIIQMVQDSASTKAPVSRAADKAAGIFVPVVMLIALVTAIAWFIAGKELSFILSRAVTVLVISCPCALGLATPVAVMVGSGKGAKNGILFKNAAVLEATGKISYAVLDKTGTMTLGEPVVVSVKSADNFSEKQLIDLAYALETGSEHPIARSICRYAVEHNAVTAEAEDFISHTGFGVEGSVNGKTAFAGNLKMMLSRGIIFDRNTYDIDTAGTMVYFAYDGAAAGYITLADTLRDDTALAVAELKRMGITTVMLTGDNHFTAEKTAAQAGIDAYGCELLPGDKQRIVSMLSAFGGVLMAGDGINDAPALSAADVGIAVGAGTDVAMDSADAVITGSSLYEIVRAIRLSRCTLRNIKENLFWAFIYNAACIPLAAGVLIPVFGIALEPMFGAAAMSLSSVCVVLNALRLNLVKLDKHTVLNKKQPMLPVIDGISVCNGDVENKTITEEKIMQKKITIDGMMCEHCTAHVQKALSGVAGVKDVSVSLEDKSAVVHIGEETTDSALKDAVEGAGYTVVSVTD